MKTLSLLFLAVAGLAQGRVAEAPTTVSHVDLDRYMGEWFVIANIPYALEKGKVATSDIYQMRPDGKIDNIFTFRKGSFDAPEKQWKGVATVINTQSNAEWKVQFIWPFKATYLVLDLDPGYRWSVVGTPDRKLLWVLARERSISSATYEAILKRIDAKGYDTTQLVKVPQPVE